MPMFASLFRCDEDEDISGEKLFAMISGARKSSLNDEYVLALARVLELNVPGPHD